MGIGGDVHYGKTMLGNRTAPALRLATLLIGGLLISGCLAVGRGDREDPYQQVIRKELVELVKLYRLCLQKNEDDPRKAKEHCGIYRDAIHDLPPQSNRRSIAEMLERLLEKSR